MNKNVFSELMDSLSRSANFDDEEELTIKLTNDEEVTCMIDEITLLEYGILVEDESCCVYIEYDRIFIVYQDR